MLNKILGIASIISIALVGYLVFFWAPIESSMGIVQKIMYIHVPSIWLTFLALFIAFLCSIGYLWKRAEIYDVVALCMVEIGVIFCGITLITGSIWAKPTWNTYWTWDARLTTTLILFLIFVGYLLLRKFMDYGEQQARFAAVVGIIGFLDVPLIHQSVTWWRTLHQPSTVFSTKKNVIDTPLLVMLLLSLLAFSFLLAFIASKRIELELKSRKFQKQIANLPQDHH
ncbi:MAG: cytochrome c biogenesis protein CcsA [Deltaproteobacteria bacterium]|nr:cytochrome c biogenesis protein CcsA [Deltaproteobacteria bacterium]